MTMSALLARAADRLTAPAPAVRLRRVRMLTFGYAAVWLLVRVAYVWDAASLPARRFEPIGVLAPLDRPPDRAAVMAVWAVALSTSVLAAIGRALRLTAPLAAVAVLLVTTFTNSFGQIFHTEHLLVLHVGVLAVAAVADPDRGSPDVSGWPLRLMMLIVVTAYVVAGIAKLRFGGSAWLDGDVLRSHVAYDNLRKVLVGDVHSAVGGWLAGVGWLWPPVAVATLVLELGAPVALLPGRIRLVWIGAVWVFHLGILVLMAILFPYQLSGVAFAAFLPAERLRVRRRTPLPSV